MYIICVLCKVIIRSKHIENLNGLMVSKTETNRKICMQDEAYC